jgi:Na+/melibiose symporter-like transporter
MFINYICSIIIFQISSIHLIFYKNKDTPIDQISSSLFSIASAVTKYTMISFPTLHKLYSESKQKAEVYRQYDGKHKIVHYHM